MAKRQTGQQVALYDSAKKEKALGVVTYQENLPTLEMEMNKSPCGVGKLKAGGFYLCYKGDQFNLSHYAVKVPEIEAKNAILERNCALYEEFFAEKLPVLD